MIHLSLNHEVRRRSRSSTTKVAFSCWSCVTLSHSSSIVLPRQFRSQMDVLNHMLLAQGHQALPLLLPPPPLRRRRKRAPR